MKIKLTQPNFVEFGLRLSLAIKASLSQGRSLGLADLAKVGSKWFKVVLMFMDFPEGLQLE